MSLIPKSWTGVDELRDKVWLLEKKIESLEMMYPHGQQPRPTPTPQREDKAASVSPAQEFYNAAGGYAWFRRNVTEEQTCVKLNRRSDWKHKQYQLTFGIFHRGRSKSKTFNTRREAEQFAFDVLKIHEAECIARKKPTDWWNRVKIFEEIKP